MALIDDITIKIKAGNGGRGGRSFHQNYGTVKSVNDGGNGGHGGNIYFEGTTNLSDLNEFRYKKVIEAEDGAPGMNKNLDGKKGKNVTVLVPLGTNIIDTATEQAIEILEEEKPVLLARGGMGQNGNHDGHMPLTSHDGRAIMTPNQYGQVKELHLILNLIADIGLIGLPNAGKSSLLKALTNALPKIGDYAFTTLEPNLGVMEKSTTGIKSTTSTTGNNRQIVLADIPGLVEGASQGKGLGIQFLKHIQKTKILLHCIDVLSQEPLEIYNTVRREFEEYDPSILKKEEVILLTKIDLADEAQIELAKKALKKTKRKIILVSIYNEKTLEELKSFITTHLKIST
jgi:GTP-binding protein